MFNLLNHKHLPFKCKNSIYTYYNFITIITFLKNISYKILNNDNWTQFLILKYMWNKKVLKNYCIKITSLNNTNLKNYILHTHIPNFNYSLISKNNKNNIIKINSLNVKFITFFKNFIFNKFYFVLNLLNLATSISYQNIIYFNKKNKKYSSIISSKYFKNKK